MTTDNQENVEAAVLTPFARATILGNLHDIAVPAHSYPHIYVLNSALELVKYEFTLRRRLEFNKRMPNKTDVMDTYRSIRKISRLVHARFTQDHEKNQLLGKEDRVAHAVLTLWPSGIHEDEQLSLPEYYTATSLLLEQLNELALFSYAEFLLLNSLIETLKSLHAQFKTELAGTVEDVTPDLVAAASLNAKEAYFQVVAIVIGDHALGGHHSVRMLEAIESGTSRYLKTRARRLARKATAAQIAVFDQEYDEEIAAETTVTNP